MRGAQYLVKALAAEGVDTLFGYPGGAMLPMYDALLDSGLRHVLVRHEQAAAMAADGYARATGRVGVCCSTCGPGATNLVTGIANAHLDSIPLVAITGQVATGVLGTDAFQEVDTLGITMPVVKHSFQVLDAADLPSVVRQAFSLARSGRPGPVLIDLPTDVAAAEESFGEHTPVVPEPTPAPDPRQLSRAAGFLRAARRPVILAGGGIVLAGATAEFRRFVATTSIPAVSTLKGLGALPGDHPLFLGMVGMHGLAAANMAVHECDLLLAVGARMDDRVAGQPRRFAPEARVVHLDVDLAEVGRRRSVDAPVLGDLATALRELTVPPGDHLPWRTLCTDRARALVPSADDPAPIELLQRLSSEAPGAVVTTDVGQHQMWVAQHWCVRDPRGHLSSGGLGAMGYGLPAAIGAQFGRPDATVIAITGDGSMMMNVQELATMARYHLPLKIVVLDNHRLGMVRQWQELFGNRRYSQVDLSDNPDFTRVAEAFGVPAFHWTAGDDPSRAVERLLEPGPMLLHVTVDPEANVWPMVPPGCAGHEMLTHRSMRGGTS